MKREYIVRILVGFSALALIGFTVLTVHLYSIVKKNHSSTSGLTQLSRIDFKEAVDSVSAIHIKDYVRSVKGVKGSYFSLEHNTLVYGYTPGSVQPETMYQKVMDFTEHKYKAERFVVTADQLSKGCPAGMNNSAMMSFANFLYKIFN